MVIRSIFFILIFCVQTGLWGQSFPGRSDFIIVENPAVLTIYNVYQQPLSTKQKQKLGTFVPVQIIQENDFLGDGLTPVVKGIIAHKVVFILQNEKKFDIYRHCKIFDDTLFAQRKGLGIWRRLKGKKRYIVLEKGNRFHRIFEWKRYFYGLVLPSTPPLYGWIKKPLTTKWKKLKAERKPVTTLLPTAIRNRLWQRITAANTDYRHFFTWINNSKKTKLPVPVWVQEQDKNELKFVLKPDSMSEHLSRSTAKLLEDLQGYLIGSPWKIFYKKGVIRVKIQ